MSPEPFADPTARLRYLELGPADREQLAALGTAVLPHLDELLERWHRFLRDHPATAPLLDDPRRRGHLAELQRAYFRSLFTASPDAGYFAERARVGRVHHRVGLAPFWYLGAFRKFLALVREELDRRGYPPATTARWSEALEKAATLDLALALDAYQGEQQAALERTNRELERQMRHSRESARVKEEFLARISHALRTPLHAMLGFADLVADGIQGPVTAEQRDSLAKVRVYGERLVGMVDQLIEAAKLSAAAAPEPEPFDPGPLLEEAATFARDAAALKELPFTCTLPSSVPRVLGDRRGTAVAVRQLLDNAVRCTAAGEVALVAFATGSRLRIEVRDTGPGIPPGEGERIFEPFHQIAGDGRPSDGVGMGLTLAREAVQRSGGSLTLEQTGAAGSTFTLELPLAPAGAAG